METTWIQTEHAVYAAIYAVHSRDFTVFATCSVGDGGDGVLHSTGYMLTEWGFKDADAPLIRSIAEGDRDEDGTDNRTWTYWIAAVTEDPE